MYVFFDLGIAPHFPEFRFEVSHTFQKTTIKLAGKYSQFFYLILLFYYLSKFLTFSNFLTQHQKSNSLTDL